MIIDNFEQIKTLLTFPNDDCFYYLSILKRKKENPELDSNSRLIKTYYISNLDYFNNIEQEIKDLCVYFNARAYIGLNKRNSKKVALYTLKEVTDLIINDQYEAVKNAYNTCCGQYTTGDKTWIIDIDTKDYSLVEGYINAINKCQSGYDVNVIGIIPTINGYHILTRPFNLKELEPYQATATHIEIHKNNPTLLYYGHSN